MAAGPAADVAPASTERCVLITGGFGFIGGHLVELLCAREDPARTRLVVLDKCTYAVLDATLAAVRARLAAYGNAAVYAVDLCDAHAVQRVVHEQRVTHVLHLAAESHVDRSLGNSTDFTRTNVLGTHVLLEACRLHGDTRLFVHVSTDEVHGSVAVDADADADAGAETATAAMTMEELARTTPLVPTNPYAASKAAAEMQVLAYAKTFGMPCVITRGNNVYGPRQHPEKLIPACCDAIRRKERPVVHGDGTQIRSFIYVTDVARALHATLHHAEDLLRWGTPAGEVPVLFIGSAEERSVRSVVEDILELAGRDPVRDLRFVVDPRPFNDVRYLAGMDERVLAWMAADRRGPAPVLMPWTEGLARTLAAAGLLVDRDHGGHHHHRASDDGGPPHP